MKTVNRLIEADSGTIRVNGVDVSERDVTELRRTTGYVFQSIGLFPHRRVRENVAVVPRLLGWSAAKRRQRVDELLDLVGLPPSEFASRFPDELSGGQQQRVGFARALAADPDLILMDEPFGALDAVVREQLQQEVIRITKTLGKTVLLVTHDLFEAFAVADRVGVMHEGRLEQIGKPSELVSSPKTQFVRNLMSRPQALLEQFKTYSKDGGETP